MRIFVVATVALSINLLIHYFVWRILFRNNPSFSKRGQKIALGIFVLLAVAAPVSLVTFRFYLSTGFASTIFISISGLMFLVASILIFMKLLKAGALSVIPVSDQRREFLAQSMRVAAVAAGGAGAFHGVNEALCLPRVKAVPLALKRWPTSLNGFRIVQVTDLHVGPTIRRPYVEKVAETIRGIKPDLIVLTGDLVDGSVENLKDEIAPLFDLKAEHGVFACLGNHEYYSGVFQWSEYMKSLGIKLLRNENHTVQVGGAQFSVIGVDDWRAHTVIPSHGYDLKRALEGVELAPFKLLLAHQPKGFDQAVFHGVDLQLSGHTHGGQIWPFGALVKLAQPFVKGLHQVEDSFIYVSCGTGFWGPAIRVGAPSEITLLELNNVT